MSDRRDSLSSTAVLLLGNHQMGEPGYHSWALGLPRSPDGLEPIDAAYAELVDRGFLEPAGLPVPVFPGVIRDAFILTESARSLPAWENGKAMTDDPPEERDDFLPRNYPGAPASVDFPAPVDWPPAAPAPAQPMSFRQAVRVGIGLGIGFWLTGLVSTGIVLLAVSLVNGPGSRFGAAASVPVTGPALAVSPNSPR